MRKLHLLKFKRGIAWITFALSSLAVATIAQQGTDGDIANLKARKTSVKSAEAYSVEMSVFNRAPELQAAITEEIHKKFLNMPSTLSQSHWAADGTKFRAERRVLLPENFNPTARDVMTTYDGVKSQFWSVGSPTVTQRITKPADAPSATNLSHWLQLSTQPDLQVPTLDSFFESKAELVKNEKLGTIETRRYEAPVTDDVLETWHIAPNFGSLVVRHERRKATPAADNSTVSWRHLTIVDKAEKIDDVWIPTQSRFIIFVTLRNGKEYWENWTRVEITEARFNKPLNASPFELNLPLQTQVSTEGKDSYIIGGEIRKFLSPFASRLEQKDLSPSDLADVPLTSTLK